MEPGHIARCAQLAMLLEVSATPKPGNIDRDHNYPDTRFEHFLASAVGVYPLLEAAATSHSGVGSFIRQAVTESSRWQKGGNTHFGAFILLIPLVMAAGECNDRECLKAHVKNVIRSTTIEDAVELYRTFSLARVRVKPVNDLDLGDKSSIDKIRERKLTMFDLMKLSSGYDIIADEWVNGFRRTFECADLIMEKSGIYNINDAVVLTFMELLSRNKDTFIQTKFDIAEAEEVSMRAKEILEKGDIDNIRGEIRSFDEDLLRKGINPGSTADMIIGGLFISLFEGMRF